MRSAKHERVIGWLALAGCMAHIAVAIAQAEDAARLTAEQIIAKQLEAAGGKEKLEAIEGVRMKGRVELANQAITGTVEVVSKPPDKLYVKQTIAGIGDIVQAYNGEVGWSQDPFLGLRRLEGDELANFKLGSQPSLFFEDLDETFAQIDLLPSETVDERTCYVVRLEPFDGTPMQLYIDQEDFLQRRTDVTVVSPTGRMQISTYIESYREVGGLKFAARLRQITPMGPTLIQFSQIDLDPKLEDDLFAPPAELPPATEPPTE